MTPTETAALKELAEKAITGPWTRLHDAPGSKNHGCDCAQVWADQADWMVANCDTQLDRSEGFTREAQMANAAYIAAANPSAILRLLSSHAALQEANRELVKALELCVEELSIQAGVGTEFQYDADHPAMIALDAARAATPPTGE